MSYSFSVRGRDAAAALAAADLELSKVVANCPEHQKDRATIIEAIAGGCSALKADPSKDVVVSASGSIGWNGAPAEENVTSFALSLSISHSARE